MKLANKDYDKFMIEISHQGRIYGILGMNCAPKTD